jgi:hypothetical protein
MFTTEQYRTKASKYGLSDAGHLRVDVKHRWPAPDEYTWEIFRNREALPVAESFNRFGSWEEVKSSWKEGVEEIVGKRTFN